MHAKCRMGLERRLEAPVVRALPVGPVGTPAEGQEPGQPRLGAVSGGVALYASLRQNRGAQG